MPDAALGRIALVGDPDVGPRVLHAVVLHGGLGKTHDLHDQEVPGVRDHEGPLVAQRGIILGVQPDRVLEDELVFHVPFGQAGARRQFLLLGKAGQDRRLDADEVAGHVRRADFQQRHLAIIVHGRDQAALVDVEIGLDERFLDLGPGRRIEQGHLEDIVFVEHLARDAHVFRHQPAGGDPAPFAVAAVAHLDRGLVDVPAADGDRAGEAGHAAAALGLQGLTATEFLGDQAGPRRSSAVTRSSVFLLRFVASVRLFRTPARLPGLVNSLVSDNCQTSWQGSSDLFRSTLSLTRLIHQPGKRAGPVIRFLYTQVTS